MPGPISKGSNAQLLKTKLQIAEYRKVAEDNLRQIKELEMKLSSMGDDSQLANLSLQNAMQKQQQALQMMSNITKLLHDAAMSTIRNLR